MLGLSSILIRAVLLVHTCYPVIHCKATYTVRSVVCVVNCDRPKLG